MGIWYSTREDVMSALDSAEPARNVAQVDRMIEAASRSVETLTHRKFYPQAATRTLTWPDSRRFGTSWRLWLDADELISLDTITSGGRTLTDYFLEPQSSGPPYTRLELDLSGSDTFGGGATGQRDITITGVFGACDDTTPAGTLADAVTSSATTLAVDGAAVGVGALLRIDDEWVQVTGRAMADTGATLTATLGPAKSGAAVTVSDGSSFTVGDTVLVDAERMLITEIAGDTLVVVRGWSGSILAQHAAGAVVYSPRTLTVARGALGTTAASHSSGAAVVRLTPPAEVVRLVIAEALAGLQAEQAGYATASGSGEASKSAASSALRDLRTQVHAAWGRNVRMRAI